MATEDIAHVLLRYEDGTRGQVDDLAGERGAQEPRCRFELDGSEGALAWNSERHEELWLGHRDRPERDALPRPRRCMSAAARAATTRPATPRASPTRSSSSTAPCTRPSRRRACRPSRDFPTFADGHEEILLGDAIARVRREGRWVEVAR